MTCCRFSNLMPVPSRLPELREAMKLVAVVAFVVAIVSMVLILRLTTMEQSESEPTISLPPSQPTATPCETLIQLLADAQTGLATGLILQEIGSLTSGCELIPPR